MTRSILIFLLLEMCIRDRYRAALCRAQADWLVGINGTRLYSRLYGTKLNVGRVMTPTLAMVVQREKEIAAFQVERFYTCLLYTSPASV